jgi:hypothetical protein
VATAAAATTTTTITAATTVTTTTARSQFERKPSAPHYIRIDSFLIKFKSIAHENRLFFNKNKSQMMLSRSTSADAFLFIIFRKNRPLLLQLLCYASSPFTQCQVEQVFVSSQ